MDTCGGGRPLDFPADARLWGNPQHVPGEAGKGPDPVANPGLAGGIGVRGPDCRPREAT
jgi:hypothetical protein